MAALVELYNTDHQALVAWIVQAYALARPEPLNEHRLRREAIATRLQLYRDQVELPLKRVIERVYTTTTMRETMLEYMVLAKGQNVTRRIVNEISSLYDRPARRTLKQRDVEFHAEEQRLGLHFLHQEALRLTNLCNEVLVWQFRGVDDRTRLRIVTPDAFDAVAHPADALEAAGFLLDFKPATILPVAKQLPCWELWDDTYRYRISGEGRLVDAHGAIVLEPEAHGLGRIPGVLFHRRQPTTCILDASYGEDIKSAHLAVALLDAMIMRLAKTQGERQPVLQGNLAQVVKGQAMNGEAPLILPPEVVASMLEMKTDPDHYLAAKRDKITSVAQTYGMSYEQFTLASVPTSGKEYLARREKLIELRTEQRMRAKVHEVQVVELMGFDPTGMRIDFQEQAAPMDAQERLALLKAKLALGLDSANAYLQREDPDLTADEAAAEIHVNLVKYAALITAVRVLNMPAGADATNPGQTPEANGAMGGRPAADAS